MNKKLIEKLLMILDNGMSIPPDGKIHRELKDEFGRLDHRDLHKEMVTDVCRGLHKALEFSMDILGDVADGKVKIVRNKDGHPVVRQKTEESDKVTGETSDGYHTFNELYAHRVRLFSSLMNAHSNRAWWSRCHHDDSVMPGWIIAGLDTDNGTLTYHLPESEIFNMPPGTELDRGKPWDGHKSEDVLHRLLNLPRLNIQAIWNVMRELEYHVNENYKPTTQTCQTWVETIRKSLGLKKI